MKIAEIISQNLFVRTNDNIGYDVILKGDISFTFSAYDDIIHILVDDDGIDRKLDSIDISKDAKNHTYVKSYVDQGVDACVVIMRHHESRN